MRYDDTSIYDLRLMLIGAWILYFLFLTILLYENTTTTRSRSTPDRVQHNEDQSRRVQGMHSQFRILEEPSWGWEVSDD